MLQVLLEEELSFCEAFWRQETAYSSGVVKLTGTFCKANGIFRTFVKIGNSVNKQFYVNISTPDVFCWLQTTC